MNNQMALLLLIGITELAVFIYFYPKALAAKRARRFIK